ncbi:MAG: hypothetical protein HY809_08800 [Nitrospirae bacterium]|nr:hypothetical protein [Nitrospirota bacterium]
MRKGVVNFILSNKISVLLLALIIIAAAYIAAISAYAGGLSIKNLALKEQASEIQSISSGLIGIKEIVETKERKIGSGGHKGIVTTLEELLNSLSMKASVLKPSGQKRNEEYVEEDAELEISTIDLNGIVNLLYRIDSAPEPMKVKSIYMQATFENRDIFKLSLTVSLLSRPQ